MNCPHCESKNIYECKRKTQLGYKQYRCRSCFRQYNERTETKFNYIEYPNEIIILAIHHYYRFKVSLDDVTELMSIRGINLNHQTIHHWSQIFGIELGLKLRERRKGKSEQALIRGTQPIRPGRKIEPYLFTCRHYFLRCYSHATFVKFL